MPFARVANKWLSQDQTVPSSITAKFRGKSFTVHELALDTDFSSVDPSQYALLASLIHVGSDCAAEMGRLRSIFKGARRPETKWTSIQRPLQTGTSKLAVSEIGSRRS